MSAEPPRVLHYGLLWEVKGHNYAFDKSWYKNFDPQQCGPWDLSAERPTAGLFPPPPSPSTFTEVTVCYFFSHALLTACLASKHYEVPIGTCTHAASLPGQDGLQPARHEEQVGVCLSLWQFDMAVRLAMQLVVQGPFLLKLLLAIEPVVVLNSALCEHHLQHCPLTEQILTECAKVLFLSLRCSPTCQLHTGRTLWEMLICRGPDHVHGRHL